MLGSRECRVPVAAGRLVGGAAAALGALLLMAGAAAAKDPQIFGVTGAISLPSSAKVTAFDISFDDPAFQLYFLADRTNKTIDVVDTNTGNADHDKVIAQLVGSPAFAGTGGGNFSLAGPNGVVTVGNKELWVGDFDTVHNTGVVKVIDLNTGETTHVITTGGVARADELCYDPRDNLILVANDSEPITNTGGAPYDTFISTTTFQILGTITMNGLTPLAPLATNGIEQCEWSPKTGDFYQNIPEAFGPGNDTQPGQVLEISPSSLSIVAAFTIPLSDCAGPQGMAIGPGHDILLGCNDPNKTVPSTVVINLKGQVVKTIAGEDGADEVWFNPGDDDYFLGINSGATPGVLGVIDAKKNKAQPNPTTGAAAHSVAADAISNEVYVPIPSTGGTTTCSAAGGVDANGCIAVFTKTSVGKVASVH